MNPLYFHIFQLVPLFLMTTLFFYSTPLFPLDPLYHLILLLGGSLFSFQFSLMQTTTLRRWLFFLCFFVLLLGCLNLLFYAPAAGVFLAAVFVLAAVPRPDTHFSYKRLFLTSEYSLLFSYLFCALCYALLYFYPFDDIRLPLYATSLAFGSTTFLSLAKIKVDQRVAVFFTFLFPLVGMRLGQSSWMEWAYLGLSFGFAAVTVLAFLAFFLGYSSGLRRITEQLFRRPEMTIIFYFAFLGFVGAWILQLPWMQTGDWSHTWIDSFFTAVSAVCVTGLIVLDTPVDFTVLGQLTIVTLIQLGGIGIVSLSAWVLLIFQSKRLNVAYEQTITQLGAITPNISTRELIQKVIIYFLCFEGLGTLILFLAFLPDHSNGIEALWHAFFTSVSAFCNAGFSLFSDSLVPYQQNKIVLYTVSSLIIAGGFSPLVVFSLLTKKSSHHSLQERITLYTSIALLLIGFILVLTTEWTNTLGQLNWTDRLANAWFQSSSGRTAGFNTIAIGEMLDISVVIMMVLMFIGGNPGSAAGGIKTVTFFIIAASAWCALRGETKVRAFNRTIPSKLVLKAIGIVSLGISSGFIAFFMLSLTQDIDPIPLLFETVSALGTVGLSMGATQNIDFIGKIILILCMLVGRVGPLTFALLLIRQTSRKRWDVPEEDIYVS